MKQPNIIFIVADDLGFADLGCYGGRRATFGEVSPVLDQLAAKGLKLTDGYSNSPVCSPTRFALMTGRYQYRMRGAAEEPINVKSRGSTTLGMTPEHPTLPSLLLKNGYHTALIGKWHLGYPPAFGPLKSGYEEFFGPMAGGVDYFTHCASNGAHDLWFGESEQKEEGYLTDLISDRSVDYIQRMASDAHTGKPFFLSVHYTAPHWPWETRDDGALAETIKDDILHLNGGNIHTYQRMIHHMDEGIGKIMRTLESLNLVDNTLVIFTSDNGGERFSDNWPLVGGKMDLTEGGIRVPWIAHWPDRIAAGKVSAQHCMTMDWSVTILDTAGVRADENYPFDGVSLLSVLKEPSETFHRPLFWRMKYRNQRAMRDGDFKYLQVDGIDYLFNIPADQRERANLAKTHPEKLIQMRADWESWNQTMPAIPSDATVSLGYTAQDMPQR
ncbi:MAG: sulfatase-like hydrolase/transferase [Burkholderiaceae bacterium]|nr:sulfatase-like hydrolase/transferase [Burkholderiaceae bacterium]